MTRYEVQAERPDNTLITLATDTRKDSAVRVAKHLARGCDGWAVRYHVVDTRTETFVFAAPVKEGCSE